MKKIVVNKNDLVNNVKILKNILDEKVKRTNSKGAKIIPVVKANGYGLDLAQYSKVLIECGIDILSIATFEEAEILINANLGASILMLSPINNDTELEHLIANDVILTIGSKENLDRAERVAEKLGKNVFAHTKIDVGLGRYGFVYNDFDGIKYVYENAKRVKLVGIYSHMVNSVVKKSAEDEFNKFKDVLSFIEDNGYETGLRHICASRPFILYDEYILDAVRLGSIITGRTPFKVDGLKRVGEYETEIAEVKIVPKGHTISYGAEFKAKKDMKIALISTGYIDGFVMGKQREVISFKTNVMEILKQIKNVFSKNKFKVLINDKSYDILGQVGMFHTAINVDGTDVKTGDKVIIKDIHVTHINPNIRREYI